MKLETHVILVSAQATPNLTPLLDERFKPRQVIMLVSDDMQQRAGWLEAIIKTKGIKTSRWHIDKPYDIEHIRDQMLELISPHQHDAIALNATGGTKPMSIAAFDVFRAFEKPIFYVHPEHDRLIWMYPENQSAHDLADRIKLPEFLKAYGANVIGQGDKQGVSEKFRVLTQTLISQAQTLSAPLGILNAYAYAATAKATHSAAIDRKHLQYSELITLIDLFKANELLDFRNNRLTFSSEAARFYINGGWLEQHVYGQCLNLKKAHGVQDIGRSIEVERSHRNPPVRNEMDVAFLKDNRLYVIECKTHTDKNHANSKSADALYKLDSLKDLLGGLQARAMLVSFNSPNAYDLQRARDLNIAVCAQQDLSKLSEKLTAWIT
ncbi:MAG: Card1-like endonuclease domain-containing protein [Methylococcaceae bacterium]